MDIKLSDKTLKRLVLLGSGIAIGYYIYLSYRNWRKRQLKSIDEGFEDASMIEENLEKRVLVLGLENAGKSTLISQISTGSVSGCKDIKPTDGFNVTTIETNGICLKVWELGGKENIRSYWPNFLHGTDILVFVVDAFDFHNLVLAMKEVKWLLADERLAHVPVLLVANKQDKKNALLPYQVVNALDLNSVPSFKHKIHVIGTQAPPNSDSCHPSISELEKMIQVIIND